MNELQEIAERVRAGKETLSFLRAARSMIPDKERRDAIDKKIRKAEDALNRCSARIAKLTEKEK